MENIYQQKLTTNICMHVCVYVAYNLATSLYFIFLLSIYCYEVSMQHAVPTATLICAPVNACARLSLHVCVRYMRLHVAFTVSNLMMIFRSKQTITVVIRY